MVMEAEETQGLLSAGRGLREASGINPSQSSLRKREQIFLFSISVLFSPSMDRMMSIHTGEGHRLYLINWVTS